MGVDFYSLKPYVLLLYGSFGLACLGVAGTPGLRVALTPAHAIRGKLIAQTILYCAAAVLLVVYFAVGSYLLLDAVVISAIVLLAQRDSWTTSDTLFGGISVAAIVLSLVWWRIEPSAAKPLPLAIFAIVLAALSFGLGDPGRSPTRRLLLPTSLFVVGGVALLADLGAFRAGQTAIATLVHHWGAFIGPALHFRAGLVPFYDIPMQYGLGPTISIAMTCDASGCWRGAQILFAGADIVGALLVLSMALATRTPRGWIWTLTATIVIFATVFFWPGFPAEGSALTALPSSSAFRFLPVTFVAWFWFFDRPKSATVAMVPALLWSPESAAMATAVFGLCATAHLGLRRAVVLSALLLIGSYAALFLVHKSLFGVWIDPMALIEYVVHVPGALPINPFSDILLLAATLGLGGWLVWDASSDPQAQRRNLAVTALLFAVSSYTLGRSHPNNVCNLAPFLVLVAFRALDRPVETDGAVGKATAFGMAVSVAALAFSPWSVVPFDPHVVMDINAVVAAFPAQEPDVVRIRAQVPRAPALGIADFGPYYARHPSETIVWTPMDPSSLWSFVPSERRQVYIKRSAHRLGRSGWGIFTERQLMFLADLQSAYKVTNRRSVDGVSSALGSPPTRYTVACFDPKPEFAATTTGPPCPVEENAPERTVGPKQTLDRTTDAAH